MICSRREQMVTLIIENEDKMRAAAYKITGRRFTADDLYQDSVLKALRFFSRYDPSRSFMTWMNSVMIKSHLDSKRSPQYRFAKSCVNDFLDSHSTGENLFGSATIEQIRSLDLDEVAYMHFDQEVYEALLILPDGYKEVLMLYALGEFKYKEIAEGLDVPLGTVMSRLSRARKLLRPLLADYCKRNGII